MTIIEKRTKKIYDFDIRRIVRIFEEKDEDDQVKFIRMKLNDLQKIEEIELNWLNRIKRAYLLKRQYLGLMLTGLLYQAEQFRQ